MISGDGLSGLAISGSSIVDATSLNAGFKELYTEPCASVWTEQQGDCAAMTEVSGDCDASIWTQKNGDICL